MARQGDALENPVAGERLLFRRTRADSGGAVLAIDYFLAAGGSVPLAHVHPRQVERFAIVSGRARIRVGGGCGAPAPGKSVLVPRGTVHRLLRAPLSHFSNTERRGTGLSGPGAAKTRTPWSSSAAGLSRSAAADLEPSRVRGVAGAAGAPR